MEKRNINTPDEERTFPLGAAKIVTVGGISFTYITAQPGWKWSKSVKPLVNTPSCQAPHTQFHISGRLRVRMDDGTEAEFGPGDISVLPPGHDAWVVGNDPVVVLDITGAPEFAKKG